MCTMMLHYLLLTVELYNLGGSNTYFFGAQKVRRSNFKILTLNLKLLLKVIKTSSGAQQHPQAKKTNRYLCKVFGILYTFYSCLYR